MNEKPEPVPFYRGVAWAKVQTRKLADCHICGLPIAEGNTCYKPLREAQGIKKKHRIHTRCMKQHGHWPRSPG